MKALNECEVINIEELSSYDLEGDLSSGRAQKGRNELTERFNGLTVPEWIKGLPEGDNGSSRVEKSPGELLGPEPSPKLTAIGADPARNTLLYGGLVVSGLPHLGPSEPTVSRGALPSHRGGAYRGARGFGTCYGG